MIAITKATSVAMFVTLGLALTACVTVNGPSTRSTGSPQAGSRLRQDASARQAGQGKPWTEFNQDKETITLKGLTGTVAVTAQY